MRLFGQFLDGVLRSSHSASCVALRSNTVSAPDPVDRSVYQVRKTLPDGIIPFAQTVSSEGTK